MNLHHTTASSPLGSLLLVADDDEQLRGIYLPNHRGGLVDPPGREDGSGVLADARTQLGEYFAGERTAFDLPLATSGSPLQERVWEALREVPFGTTTTYGEIASDLSLRRGSARAVGAANGRNPISIVVPCHRVIGASGALTGYAGGVKAKSRLLAHEARIADAGPDLDR